MLDGSDERIRGNYKIRPDAIKRCYVVARERGLKIFAIQDGGQCFGSRDKNRYKKYKRSRKCANMKGGYYANDVYLTADPKGKLT